MMRGFTLRQPKLARSDPRRRRPLPTFAFLDWDRNGWPVAPPLGCARRDARARRMRCLMTGGNVRGFYALLSARPGARVFRSVSADQPLPRVLRGRAWLRQEAALHAYGDALRWSFRHVARLLARARDAKKSHGA